MSKVFIYARPCYNLLTGTTFDGEDKYIGLKCFLTGKRREDYRVKGCYMYEVRSLDNLYPKFTETTLDTLDPVEDKSKPKHDWSEILV